MSLIDVGNKDQGGSRPSDSITDSARGVRIDVTRDSAGQRVGFGSSEIPVAIPDYSGMSSEELSAKETELRNAAPSRHRDAEWKGLWKAKAALGKSAEAAATPERSPEARREQDREFQNELANRHGWENFEALGDSMIGNDAPFTTSGQLEAAFNHLAPLDRLGATHQAIEIVRPSDVNIEPAETTKQTEKGLSDLWGSQLQANLESCRREAKLVFGSLEKAELWLTRQGAAHDPNKQIKAMTLLLRLANARARGRR
jgi:hypothetical protein